MLCCYHFFFQIRRPLGTLFELLLPVIAILILIGLRFAHRYIIVYLSVVIMILSISADSAAYLKPKTYASWPSTQIPSPSPRLRPSISPATQLSTHQITTEVIHYVIHITDEFTAFMSPARHNNITQLLRLPIVYLRGWVWAPCSCRVWIVKQLWKNCSLLWNQLQAVVVLFKELVCTACSYSSYVSACLAKLSFAVLLTS